MKFLILAVSLTASSTFAMDDNRCLQFDKKPVYISALKKLAANLSYDYQEMCEHPRILDIFISDTIIYNEKQEPIPHTWVTLHYNAYSCQYFLKTDDLSTTKMNCYNTW